MTQKQIEEMNKLAELYILKTKLNGSTGKLTKPHYIDGYKAAFEIQQAKIDKLVETLGKYIESQPYYGYEEECGCESCLAFVRSKQLLEEYRGEK